MKKLGILLIVIGIAITSYPLVNQWVDAYLQERLLDDMEFLDGDAQEGLNELGSSFDTLNESTDEGTNSDVDIVGYDRFSNEDSSTDTENQVPSNQATTATGEVAQTTAKKPAVKLQAIGRISIPSIDVKMPVVEGTGTEALRRSAGHMKGTDMPGEIGNSVIAGHRGYSFGRLFNRLDELKKGDKIIVKTKEGEFTYEVYETKIVEPTDLSVLNRNSKDRVLTLITCTPMFKSTHRIIIHAVMR